MNAEEGCQTPLPAVPQERLFTRGHWVRASDDFPHVEIHRLEQLPTSEMPPTRRFWITCPLLCPPTRPPPPYNSFSGTSSCAKAFLSNKLSDLTSMVAGRPDLHLLRSPGGRGAGDRGRTSPRPTPSSSPSRPRCASPASTLVASMHHHHRGRHASAAAAAADGAAAGMGAAIGRLSGGG